MKNWKYYLYLIVILILFFYNAHLILDWMNKSLFIDWVNEFASNELNTSFNNGVSLLFLLFLFFFSILGTATITIIIANMLFIALIYANHIKVMERNEYITFKELKTILAPKELLSFVSVDTSVFFLGLVLFIVLLVFIHLFLVKSFYLQSFKTSIKIRVIIFTISSMLLFAIFLMPNIYNKHVVNFKESDIHNFNPVKKARKDGYLSTLISTIDPKYMNVPEEYNKEKMLQINEKYTEISKDINKTRNNELSDDKTILYLSESLMDPSSITNLLQSESPIKYITEIQNNNTSGNMYSQFIGGGTANIEWSVLTSFNLEFLDNPVAVTPYSDFYKDAKNHSSVLSLIDENKIAIHPYTAHLYNRKSIYEEIGFDKFLFKNNGIKYTNKIKNQSRISDASLSKDILDVIDQKENKLIHALSMQNHSPYDRKITNSSYTPVINEKVYPKEQIKYLNNYLQSIYETDKSVEYLINEINKSKSNINLLFYGDHLPSLFRGLEEDYGENKIYRTPWFIYSNYNTKNMKLDNVSPIFLVPILLESSEYKLSPLYSLLSLLLDEGITRIGDGYVYYQNEKQDIDNLNKDIQELINDYYLIQYDALFGKNYLGNKFYDVY